MKPARSILDRMRLSYLHWRLGQVVEAVSWLEDQEMSARVGLRMYREKQRRLEDSISTLESPARVLRDLIKRAL